MVEIGSMQAKDKSKRNKEKTWIGAGEFKAHCLQLIDVVHQSRVPLIITKHGKPMARLLPYEEKTSSLFGCMKESVIIHGDIVGPTGETWEADVS